MSTTKISVNLDDEIKKNVYSDDMFQQYLNDELEKSINEANDPNIVWQTHNDIMNKLQKQRAERDGKNS